MKYLARIPQWAWLVSLSAALRLPTLGGEALWYDETFTAWVAGRLDWTPFWAAVAGDVHPPLWYALEALVVRLLGVSEFTLRLPAAIAGVGSTLLLWQVAGSIGFARRTAFMAGVLVAVLPASIYYGQEARMYTLLSFFVLLSVQAALARKWLWFGVGCLGAVYSQNLGVFYVFTLGLTALWQERRQPLRLVKPALALSAVVAAWSPWGVVMLGQARGISQSFWLHPLTVSGALEPLVTMTMGWRIPEVLLIHVYAAALGATGVGLLVSRRWLRTRQGFLVLSTALGTPVLVALISFVWRSVYLPRAFLPSALLLMLFWAYALLHLGRQNRRVFSAILLPMLVVGILSHYFGVPRFDWRAWLRPVHEDWQEGDVVYHPALSTAITFAYYLDGKPYLLRSYSSDLNQALTDATRTAFGFKEGTFEDAAAQHERVWLLFYTNPMSHADELSFLAWARQHATLVAHKSNTLSEVSIYLYKKKSNDNSRQ